MTDITIDGLKSRKRALEIDVALAQGAVDEISHIIAEMERRRGGRPRKGTAGLSVINEPECDEQGPLPSLDDMQGILKGDDAA